MRPAADTCKRGHPASDSHVATKLRWNKTEQQWVAYQCRECLACRRDKRSGSPAVGIRLFVTLSGR